MSTGNSKAWYKRRWVWIVAVILLLGAIGSANNKSTTPLGNSQSAQDTASKADEKGSTTTEQKSTPKEQSSPEPTVAQPATQQKFLGIINDARTKYTSASTELQRSEVLRGRNNELCSVNGSRFSGWVGTFSSIGATGDGYAHIEVRIEQNVRLMTWNNAVSDSRDNTLIKPGNDLFDSLVKMENGASVTVSGEFVSSDDSCVKASNLTDVFQVNDPKFIVRFSDVKQN